MEPERWRRLSDLFHRALELSPEDRPPFLDQACANDASLRAEVASLLDYHEGPDDLLGLETAKDTAGGRPMPATSLVGHRLGHYVVTRQLGAGGMGVVYLADDTRLGRQVAIKALAREFTQDAPSRERLRREARAAAALSHPGIATVYALEEIDTDLYIVTEYVPGETLRQELARGPLPTDWLLETAVEVARALAAAHEHGVIHRDLKPDNLIRTPTGIVKILDFGLARVRRPDGGSATRLTNQGTILGTPGYMPPEQIRGFEVDFRADIFAFGVTLYELASGVHPFTSSSVASTIARVLEFEPPDVVQLNPVCPPALGALIGRCLEKDPGRRFTSTTELAERLEDIRGDVVATKPRPLTPASTPGGPKPRGRFPETPLGWWQFHQVIVGVLYCLMLIPLWFVRGWSPGPWGSLTFFTGVAAVGVASTLRLHLWFASEFNRDELDNQRTRTFGWIRLADWLFVLLLLGGSLLAADEHPGVATLLVSVAVGILLAFLLIEPGTTRAAFKR